MGIDRRRWFLADGTDVQTLELDPRFEHDFQRFMHGEENVRPVNEEIERVYRYLKPHQPKVCPHGKTFLTCSQCYIDGTRGWSF